MRKRSELLISVLQIPVDYLMLVVSFVLAYFLREGSGKPFSVAVGGYTYLNFMLIFLPIWLLIFFSVGLYSLRSDRRKWISFGKILAACSAGVMVMIVIDFIRVEPIFPAKSVPIYGFLLALLLVSFGRVIMTIIQRLLAFKGVGVYSVLFIGSGKAAEELKSTLKKLKHRYKIAYTLDDGSKVSAGIISKISSHMHIDTVIFADNKYEDDVLTEVLAFCQSRHIGYQYMPSMSGMYTSKILSTQIGSIPVLELKRTPIEGWGRIIKRLFDVIIATILAIISLPIQISIYFAIKIKDPGPVFYLHECYGRNGKKINVYKFRTMKAEFSLGPKFGGRTIEDIIEKLPPKKAEELQKTAKIKNDPRVSRLGRFLRKTSLDELPQLFNVIRGDLSLVGPRPLPESELKLLGGKENLAKIVTIRPGITGLWQVSGRNDLEYSERVKLNIYYIENWSLWLDIKILFKTLWQAVFERNGI